MNNKKTLTQSELAYNTIAQLILKGKLSPGQPMNEVDLCRLTGTSRTPVREAINRLSQEKIVKIIPRKGAFVTKLDYEDIREIFQLREAIEGMAARLACGKVDIEKLNDIESRCHTLLTEPEPERMVDHIRLNDELHSYILDSCGNKRFKEMIDQFTTVLHIEMNITVHLKDIVEHSCEEHTKIIEALKNRDEDTAEKEMRLHVSEVYERLVDALTKGYYL